jgi:large subunit ribosomal protein L3
MTRQKKVLQKLIGHAKKAGTSVKRKVVEFKGFDEEYKLGDAITVDQFNEGEFVDISGTSKGKGFQGVVKRHMVSVVLVRLRMVSTTV